MTNDRKLAIKNLKGNDEQLRVTWMLKNMKRNKTYKYFSKGKSSNEKELLLENLKKIILIIEMNGEAIQNLQYKKN